MNSSDYEYRGLLASSWDFMRGDPALDVGCGTGRLLLEFLADGLDVDGVDNSSEMLALCAEKARQKS